MPVYTKILCPWHTERTPSCIIYWDLNHLKRGPHSQFRIAKDYVRCLGCDHEATLDAFNAHIKTLPPERQVYYENVLLDQAEQHFSEGR